MATTTPDSIFFRTTTDAFSDAAESASQASSIQNALNLRERYDFVWATSTDRSGQTGMVQSSRGYQVDSKTEYIYDTGAWRLQTPHVEFTVTASITNGVYQGIGILAQDAGNSTDLAAIISTGTSGGFTVANPGIYAITASIAWSPGTAAGDWRMDVSTTAAPTVTGVLVRSRVVGSTLDFTSVTLPNKRVTAANTNFYINVVQAAGSTQGGAARVMVTRLG